MNSGLNDFGTSKNNEEEAVPEPKSESLKPSYRSKIVISKVHCRYACLH